MNTVFAVDIGGTAIKAARVDETGHILDQRRIPTPATLDAFRTAARELTAALGAGCSAIGIGCKGRIATASSLVEVLPGTVHYLEGHHLSAFFGDGQPLAADNDARVALIGERRWGAAQGYDDVILLTLGTGVGGGVITGGRILRGAVGLGGHIGHYTIEPHGVPCICGNRGCLETIFSAKAIESAAFAAVHRGAATSLAQYGPTPTCEQVFAAAQAADPIALDIVHQANHALAAALAGLAFVFDPQIIILGGQIAAAGDLLFLSVREQLHARTRLMFRRDIPVVPTQLADPSGVLGAAALALDLLPHTVPSC